MRIYKWLIGGCLAVLVVLGMSMRTNAALLDASGIYEYEENSDGTVSITGYKGTGETVTIPSEIDGKAVSGIRGFGGHKEIKHVIISEGIVDLSDAGDISYLDRGAFEDCINLETVSLPSTLKRIGNKAFDECGSLSEINLPESLEEIGERAFGDCKKLASVVLPDGLTGIESLAFAGCSSLENIILPEGITQIALAVFDGCNALTDVVLPNGLVSIGEYAFCECQNLMSISFSDGLTSIGSRAFKDCVNLGSIFFPKSLERIGDDAFMSCINLASVSFSEGLKSIGEYAFYGCKSLDRLVIPDSVNEIGEQAFDYAYHESIPIYGNPNSYVKKYADEYPYVIFRCVSHVHVVDDPEIPATCDKDGQTFGRHCADCGAIIKKPEKILHGHKISTDEIPATCDNKGYRRDYCTVCGKTIREYSWVPRLKHQFDDGVVNVKAREKIYTCTLCGKMRKSKVFEVKKNDIVSDSDFCYKVTKGGKKNGTVEFQEMKTLKTRAMVPDTVKMFGAVYKVTSIAKSAFKDNKSLKKVIIGKNVTKIGAGAFQGCKNLKTVTVKSKNLKSVGKNAFAGISPKARIKVSSGKLSTYKKLFKGRGQKSTVKVTK